YLLLAVVALAGCGTAEPCSDGARGGDETDVDCGGATCGNFADRQGCTLARDCVSGYCSNGSCDAPAGKEVSRSGERNDVDCGGRMKDGDKTDIDCGGAPCAKCAAGKACLHASDCASGHCINNLCTSAGDCGDKVKDGDETDVDCGGSCGKCADGKSCLKPGD